MVASPPRSKRTESLISLVLLLLLVFIGIGVFVKQFYYQPGRLGLEGAVLVHQSSQPGRQAKAPVIPPPPDGYETLSDVETFDGGNLFNKIDGKAELYLQSGFVKLTCRRFVDKADEEEWMELYIYDMGSARNAFSVYSVQRRPDAEPLASPILGYQTGGAVFLVAGNFYIEIIGSVETSQLDKAMLAVATGFVQRLGPKENVIPELAFFPRAGLVAHSYKLSLSNAFGFDGFTDTFSAGYDLDGIRAAAFFSRRADSKQAQVLAERYYKFLIENGAADRSAIAKDVKGRAVEFYGDTEIVFTVGPFVAGVRGVKNEATAKQLATKLYEQLAKVKEK